ncbi:MAG: ADP-heptose:LPS heptosyltransferase [Verrucomicrobiales bacterium]|nr:ADP-heptose:LPS heptosyltransferase [Verrucomicrobiales bacterium]
MHVLGKKKLILSYALNVFLYLVTLPSRLFRKNRKPDLQNPRILVSRPDHIGDAVLSTPVFHSLKDKYPSSKIVLICGSWAAAVLKNNTHIDELWIIDCPWWTSIRKDAMPSKSSFFQTYKLFLERIKKENFDVFIELRGDIRHTFLFGWLPNIPIRMGNDRSGGDFLLTNVEKFQFEPHEIEKNYQVLRSLEPLNKYNKTEIFPSASDSVFFDKFPIQSKYVVLFNGGRSPLRHLPLDTLIELIRQLHKKHGFQCVMVGNKEDAEAASQIDSQLRDTSMFLSVCGMISLLEVRELIARAALFIGTDSSVSHILASTKTPAISLYGPMLPGQVKPLGEEKRTIYHQFPCSPCLQTKCVVNQSFTESVCMRKITAEEVMILAEDCLVTFNRLPEVN